MKLSFAVLAATMVLALSVSAVPAPQTAAVPIPTSLTAVPTTTPTPTATATATPIPDQLNVGNVLGGERSFDRKDPAFGAIERAGEPSGVNAFDDTTDVIRLRMNRFIVMSSATRIEQVQINFTGTNKVTGAVGDQNKGAGIERLNTPGVDRKTINLTEGEMVNALTVTVDRTTRLVIGLTMGTTKNQIFSTGSQQGEQKPFIPPSSDFGLIGFTGSADNAGIVSLGPIWGVLPIGIKFE